MSLTCDLTPLNRCLITSFTHSIGYIFNTIVLEPTNFLKIRTNNHDR